MIAGHSLLAMLAAAVGGVAAPIVAGLCGRHRLPDEPLTSVPGPRSSGASR